MQALGGTATLCALGLGQGCESRSPERADAPPPTPEYAWQFFFDPRERATVVAILERLLPQDAGSGAPSATQLRVAEFLDAQLALPHFRELHRMMRGGFDFVDKVASKRFGAPFVSLSVDGQNQVLSQFQTGAVKGLKFPQERFFETLRTFALEGYWSHPRYGGNFERGAWSWVAIHPHCNHMHGSCSE